MDVEDKEIIYISSSDRIAGDSSNFLFKMDIDTNALYDHITVLQASIPKSYYLISSDNDEFILNENLINVVIKIPNGNYTINAFKKTITDLLNVNSPNNWIYSVSFPNGNTPNTGKFIFTVSGNNAQPKFIFNEYLFEQFGFNSGTYEFNNNSLTSINVINLQLLNAVFIHSNISDNKNNNILQEIYSNNSDYSYLYYQSSEALLYGKALLMKGQNTYNFYLSDKYGNPINLNGLNWNMTIMIYKKNNIYKMIKDYIKVRIMETT